MFEMSRLRTLLLPVVVPALFFAESLFAETKTPSLGYTGAPTDHGGQNCSTCHTGNPLNDPSGSLKVTVSDYVPSVQQLIHIVVQNASASQWGFQITIREQSDETLSAGTFSIPTSMTTTEQVVCEDGTQYGSPGPCGTTIKGQFAEHLNAPRGASAAAYEFDVAWMPPEQEVGRLQVYVAAVAANADGTPQGDFVYTFTQTLSNVGACSLVGTPVFHNISNGASFTPGFSSGSMVSIFGAEFQTSGRQRTAGPGDYVNGAYPTELGCVGVEVTGPGITQPVQIPIAFASPGQINAQMPEFTGVGPVTLTVLLNPGSPNGVGSAVATLNTLQAFAPAFFVFGTSMSIAAEQAGTGSLVADPAVVAGASPAKPGDIVSLFGTGFGDTSATFVAGQLATGIASLTNPITVTIGGATVPSSDVLYAGLSPGSINGLYQFNVRIPSNAPSGEVPVTISIGGSQTQAGATIPIQ
jgi:uncharacterized protein (TIGR03437 family)